ncbi:MAG: ClpP family protease [Candidatus Avoscillospira sp.]
MKAAGPSHTNQKAKEGTHVNQPEKDPKLMEQERQEIQDFGSAAVKNDHGTIYTLTIIGQVEGHQILPETAKTTKYEHVLPLLASIEESPDIDGLLILLNTVGGDIEAGLAIAEMIAGMRKPTVSLVLGGGHSIGIPLAVSAKRCMIAPTASMTIHPVRMTGVVVGAPQTYQYFNRIQEQIVDFVTANSRISRQKFLDYMMATGEIATDVGSVVYGREAVEMGLVDQLGSVGDALKYLHKQIGKNRKREKKNGQLTIDNGQ